eukprot:gnl/TRDRNA2_/TRDRNA2_52459_c0_seq1.p2 gnl/TRDRNA2_/TRDRNA2_52459_c0~~gnl/TRDRNA2_/TRDRNA2_52459_c0_seq1.p2  ORF type:complete len:244 (+),score=43.35 gnl/TRDRNA2_/TRDRNA2_52459_c0_seq1:71-802(+)
MAAEKNPGGNAAGQSARGLKRAASIESSQCSQSQPGVPALAWSPGSLLSSQCSQHGGGFTTGLSQDFADAAFLESQLSQQSQQCDSQDGPSCQVPPAIRRKTSEAAAVPSSWSGRGTKRSQDSGTSHAGDWEAAASTHRKAEDAECEQSSSKRRLAACENLAASGTADAPAETAKARQQVAAGSKRPLLDKGQLTLADAFRRAAKAPAEGLEPAASLSLDPPLKRRPAAREPAFCMMEKVWHV